MNLDTITIKELSVIQTKTAPRDFEVEPRSHHSLSYRLSGQNIVYVNEQTVTSTPHSLTVVPKNTRYIHKILTESEQIVAHFDTEEYIGDTIESFVLPAHCHAERQFLLLYSEWEKSPRVNNLQCVAILYSILAQIEKSAALEANSSKNPLLEESVSYMHSHFKDSTFRIEQLYARAYVSPAYYRRIFHKEYGLSPIQYLKQLRINYAQQLLSTGYHTVAEVSEMSGFSSPAYFSYDFKNITGFSPSKYP